MDIASTVIVIIGGIAGVGAIGLALYAIFGMDNDLDGY